MVTCVDVSLIVTRKHGLWIWFTLSYAMTKALLRLAAVWDTKQTGDLRGDTVQFIASSTALISMKQNGNIHWPLTRTVTCPSSRYRSKQITENSEWIRQTTNSLTALLTKREQVRFHKVVNTCTERRVEKRIQQMAWILSHMLRTTLCEHVNGLCPARWLNEQSITKHWFQSVRTCPYSWATGRNTWQVRNAWHAQFTTTSVMAQIQLISVVRVSVLASC